MAINFKLALFNKKDYFRTDHLTSGLRMRALRGASISISTQIIAFGIQIIGSIILSRLLTPNDFGLVTMVLTVCLLLQNFGLNGFTEAIVKIEEINHRQVSTLFWINIAVSLILTLIFIVSAPFVALFYNEPRLKHIIIGIASSIVFSGLSVQHLALLKRNMQFHAISANDVVATTISYAIPIVLAWLGWGYWALVAKGVLLPLATAGGAWILCQWRPGLPSLDVGIKPMLRFAFHTYGNFVMNYLSRNVDYVLVGRYYGSQPLGYYDRAYQLSNMVGGFLGNSLNNVAVSTFSRLCNNSEKYLRSYLNFLSILCFVGMPLSAVITLISNDFILLLIGPQWNKAGQIFFFLGPSIGVTIIYRTHGWLHLSLGTPERWFRWGIIEFIVTALCFVMGLQFGVIGVAIAYSISRYLLLWPALWYAGKPIHLTFPSVVSIIWKYYMSALCAGLSCWFILHQYRLTSHVFIKFNIFTRIGVTVFLYIMLYLILLVALYQSIKPISQFVSLFREILLQKRSGQ